MGVAIFSVKQEVDGEAGVPGRGNNVMCTKVQKQKRAKTEKSIVIQLGCIFACKAPRVRGTLAS